MPKRSYKSLYGRAHFLNLLRRDLERISAPTDSSRVIRYALRRIGEMLLADLVIQVDVARLEGTLQRPYFLALTRPAKPAAAGAAAFIGADPPAATPVPLSGGAPRAASTGAPPLTAAAAGRILEACRAFLRHPLGPVDHNLLLLRVMSEGRPISILGYKRRGRRFSREETRFGQDAVEILSENLRHRERERAQAVRERIYAKILSENRPQDVLYQILHGLKRLLQYDHSAAVLLLENGDELSLKAEIVTWTKAKSSRIGRRTPVDAGLRQWLHSTTRPLLLRAGEEEAAVEVPAGLLDPVRAAGPEEAPVRSLIVAVLRHGEQPLGCLQIRSRHAAAFTDADLQTLHQFLPLASITLYNSTLYKEQHDLLVTAERKTALADLARAISHDLNNSFGVILPLLQTMRRDLAAGEISPGQLAKDLEVVDHYSSSSARIFQGLLSVAQGQAEAASWSDLNAILEMILRMMGPNLESRKIRIVRRPAADLPRLYLRRGEMEQLFLNLIYNARDAMPDGGDLTVGTRAENDGVAVTVTDSGVGIPEQIKQRIFEPFFTTKETGSGLGLDICRSIVWDYDGRMQLDSSPGAGTSVTVWLPPLGERLRAEAEAAAPGLAPPDPHKEEHVS